MFGKALKSVFAATLIAGTMGVAGTTIANAGSNIGIYIGNGNNGVHYRSGHRHAPRYNHGYKRHRGFCGPRRALNKAWRMGVNRPHIARVNGKRIVVVGYNRGHRAKVVFKRTSNHCRVIKARGLY